MKVYTMCMDEKTQIVYMTIFSKLIYKGNSNQLSQRFVDSKIHTNARNSKDNFEKENLSGKPLTYQLLNSSASPLHFLHSLAPSRQSYGGGDGGWQ